MPTIIDPKPYTSIGEIKGVVTDMIAKYEAARAAWEAFKAVQDVHVYRLDNLIAAAIGHRFPDLCFDHHAVQHVSSPSFFSPTFMVLRVNGWELVRDPKTMRALCWFHARAYDANWKRAESVCELGDGPVDLGVLEAFLADLTAMTGITVELHWNHDLPLFLDDEQKEARA